MVLFQGHVVLAPVNRKETSQRLNITGWLKVDQESREASGVYYSAMTAPAGLCLKRVWRASAPPTAPGATASISCEGREQARHNSDTAWQQGTERS